MSLGRVFEITSLSHWPVSLVSRGPKITQGCRVVHTNARATSIRKDETSERLKSLKLSISLDGGTNLLGTRRHGEQRLSLDTVVKSILSNGSRTAHVLVRGVGAAADQANLQLLGPFVLLDGLSELANGRGEIGCERSIDVWLELVQIDLDQLVVLGTLIFTQLGSVSAGKVTDVGTLGGREILVHRIIEREQRGGGTDFSTHVACFMLARQEPVLILLRLTDGGHASAGDAVDSRT